MLSLIATIHNLTVFWPNDYFSILSFTLITWQVISPRRFSRLSLLPIYNPTIIAIFTFNTYFYPFLIIIYFFHFFTSIPTSVNPTWLSFSKWKAPEIVEVFRISIAGIKEIDSIFSINLLFHLPKSSSMRRGI